MDFWLDTLTLPIDRALTDRQLALTEVSAIVSMVAEVGPKSPEIELLGMPEVPRTTPAASNMKGSSGATAVRSGRDSRMRDGVTLGGWMNYGWESPGTGRPSRLPCLG